MHSVTPVFLASVLLAISAPNFAQSLPEAAQREIAKFPPETQSVIRQLSALATLPQPQWKVHLADMPHGEVTDFDDSGWQSVKAPSEGPKDALWYRAWIEVPKSLNGYDVTGDKVWFKFNVEADGMGPEIIYLNGRRAAMGQDLEPIVLFENAKPGDRVLVAVKLTRSTEPKHFQSVELRVQAAPGKPDPEMLWKEIFAAGALAPSLEGNASEVMNRVDVASAMVDLEALHRGDQPSFDLSISKAQSALVATNEFIKKLSVQATGNSHIDAAWLWPWTETVDVVHRTFGTALQLMDEYPQLHYAQSAAQYSEWMEQKYPSLFQQTVDRAKQNRWELVGGMWVEPDLNMPDGESLVRQLLVGKRYFRQKYGVDVRIGWNPDSFGYNWQLPQIYKKSGVDYFVTQKMSWNDTNQLPLKLFWWQSPDGSRVLTYFPSGYGGEIEPLRLTYDLKKAASLNPGLTHVMHLFGEGDHGGGPTRDMLDRGIRWSKPEVVFPELNFGSAQDFFSSVETKLDSEHSPVWNYKTLAGAKPELPLTSQGKIELPVWNDELYLEFHRGVFTTQAKHKWNMRHSEEWLLNAEKYSALAWLDGSTYPSEKLTEGWKKVLFNQFHDLAAGSGIGVIYKDAQHDYDVVHWIANDATVDALRTLSQEINTSTIPGTPVIVWNPQAWTRADLVEFDIQMPGKEKGGITVLDVSGKPLLAQVLSSHPQTNTYHLLVELGEVPALGYTVLHVVPSARPTHTDLKAHGKTLENSRLSVIVDSKTGCITSIHDKQEHFESIADGGCGNQLIAFQDKPKEYDAWNIDANFEKISTPLNQTDAVELIERGPLRATIRVTRHWHSSNFVQDISLYAGLKRVDIGNDVDWHETHILLKAAFPLAATSAEATYEIPYGAINRPTTRNNSWEAAKFEVPAIRWADLGDGKHGFSLINESKYGYDAKGNVLRLSLLRSPTSPDPNADRGHHHFSYSLYPHAGDWKQALTVRRGYEFNYKLNAFMADAHEGRLPASHSYVDLKPENVVLTAFKKTEDGDGLLLRFYEWTGQGGDAVIKVPAGAISAQLTDLMEQPYGGDLSLNNGRIVVPFHPLEIVSVRVNYPKYP
jgi:alpha-mannosidase